MLSTIGPYWPVKPPIAEMMMVLSVTPTVGPPAPATVVAVPPPDRVAPPPDAPLPVWAPEPVTSPPSDAGESPGASVVADERPPVTTCGPLPTSVNPLRGVLTEQAAATTAMPTNAAV